MNKWIKLGALSVLLLVLAACGQNKYSPIEINEAVHTCEICNMQVANDRHATQIITKEGRALTFDDLGCLYEWKAQNGTDTIGEQYVRDYHSLEWIKLSDAYYVYDESFTTPMAYGIYSFKEQAEAEKFISEQAKGQLMSAADLDHHTWEGHHGDHHGDHHGEGHHDGGGHGDDHEHEGHGEEHEKNGEGHGKNPEHGSSNGQSGSH